LELEDCNVDVSVVVEEAEDVTLAADCCFCNIASDLAMAISLSCGGDLLDFSLAVEVTDMGRLIWIIAFNDDTKKDRRVSKDIKTDLSDKTSLDEICFEFAVQINKLF
jgi:hypothetical protein